MKKILFLSNGHGEDQTAAAIIRALGSGFDISVYPLVGEGFEFKDLDVKILEPRRAMPGGGFSLRNFFALPRDLFNGLFTLFHSQIKKLISLRGQFDLIIAIGDIVPIIGALICNCPFIFIGVNKSEYYHSLAFNYTTLEKWLLKNYALKVFARDQITADALAKVGIKAVYQGNPIMDGLLTPPSTSSGTPLHFIERGRNASWTIGFLPGTRKDDVAKNIEDFEKIAHELKIFDRNIQFLIALKSKNNNSFSSLLLPSNSSSSLLPNNFEDVIYGSNIIVGLSGTGNEQAAGIGKPVVSFIGRGAQYNKKFAHAQKQLLGEALALVESNPKRVAEEVWEILNDRSRLEYMEQTGKIRMGCPGAVDAISFDIKDILK